MSRGAGGGRSPGCSGVIAGGPERLVHPAPATTAVLVCDVQERFRSVVPGYAGVVLAAAFMLRVRAELGLPLGLISEQYPKAFLHTAPDVLAAAAGGARVAEKTAFSMATAEALAALRAAGARDVVLLGLETHICVLQTALDLLAEGFAVHVCADGVASQREGERAIALARLAAAGAAVTSCESVAFQLLRDAAHPKFKAVSGLVKDYAAARPGAAHL